VDVDKNGFGLTNDDLLYADDKLLNKYISIKKLAPYRSDVVDVNRKKHANLLAAIRASAKRNKKDILKNKPIV
jgi:protein KRI1